MSRSLRIAVLIALVMATPALGGSADGSLPPIQQMVRTIGSEDGSQAIADAEAMLVRVQSTDGKGTSDADIDAVASLLRNDDPRIQDIAAETLIWIGTPARRAAPALTDALHRRMQMETPDRTGPSSRAICNALLFMNALDPAINC